MEHIQASPPVVPILLRSFYPTVDLNGEHINMKMVHTVLIFSLYSFNFSFCLMLYNVWQKKLTIHLSTIEANKDELEIKSYIGLIIKKKIYIYSIYILYSFMCH